MKVGDTVQMVNIAHENHKYKIGRIFMAAKEYFRDESRADDWMVRFEDGTELSWLESSLRLYETDYALVVRVLGEDYFA